MSDDNNYICPACGCDLTEPMALMQDWMAWGSDYGHIEDGSFEVDSFVEDDRGDPQEVLCNSCMEPIDLDALGVEL